MISSFVISSKKITCTLKGAAHQKARDDEGTAESPPDARVNKDEEEMVRARATQEMKCKDVER